MPLPETPGTHRHAIVDRSSRRRRVGRGCALFLLEVERAKRQLRELAAALRQKEEAYASEFNKLEKIRHIPDIIEQAQIKGASRSTLGGGGDRCGRNYPAGSR